MTALALACAYFVGIHVVISGSPLRRWLVARLGEGPYLGLFSLLSAAGMVWLVQAYRHAPLLPLWVPAPALRWVALALVFVAFLLVVLGLTTPNPTAAGFEAQLDAADPVRGVLRISRHPFLCGVAVWAIAHLLVNADLAALILFGSLLGLALVGPLLIDHKRRRAYGAKWERFAAVTSIVPFAAIAAGRNRFCPGEIGAGRLALGVAIFAVMLAAHGWLFGVSALPAG